MDTNKRTTRTRTQLSTARTDLGSVVRSNPNNLNSLSFSFVLDKTLQLEETPIANPIIHSLSSSDVSYSFEVFHNNFASVKIVHNFLADSVIDCSHKTLLSTRDFLEQSLSRPCSFALQFTPQESESSFNLLDLGRMEKLGIRSYSEIMNSQVHTENSVRTRAHGAFLGECEHKKTFAFGIDSQKTFINFPTEIILETARNSKRNFDSSIDSGDTQNIIFERETSGRIISNGTEFNKWFGLCFFDNPTSLFDAGNSELRRQSNFSQFTINKWMQFNIIPNSHFPCLVNAKLQSSFVNLNGSDNFRSCFNFDFSSRSDSHRFFNHSDFKYLMEGISPPKHECMGIRNATFI